MAQHYMRFLDILKKWPVDKSRGNLCFGQHLRSTSSAWFTKDGKTIGNVEECVRRLDSLEKLANNFYGRKYITTHIKPATLLSSDECSKVIAEEYSLPDKKDSDSTEYRKKEASSTSANKIGPA